MVPLSPIATATMKVSRHICFLGYAGIAGKCGSERGGGGGLSVAGGTGKGQQGRTRVNKNHKQTD